VEPGEALSVTVLEPYDENTTFRYDLVEYFGENSVAEWSLRNCSYVRDLQMGEVLTVDALKWYVEEDGKSCNQLALSVHDTPLVTFGPPTTAAAVGAIGGPPMGLAQHYYALIEGCERSWIAYFLVRRAEGVGPLEAAVPGDFPPVLLMRDIGPTSEACSYTEEANRCLFVVQLEKEGG